MVVHPSIFSLCSLDHWPRFAAYKEVFSRLFCRSHFVHHIALPCFALLCSALLTLFVSALVDHQLQLYERFY